MSALLALFRREFGAYFATPFGWVLLAVTQFILSFQFIALIALYQLDALTNKALSGFVPGVTEKISLALLSWSVPFLLLLIPLATMRAWSDEQRHATLPLLIGAPVRRMTLCLGKYLGTLAFVLIPIGLLAMMTVALELGTTQDLGKLFAGLLALALLTVAGSALGLYYSSLTRHPATAALATAGTLLFFWHIDWSAGTEYHYVGFAHMLALPGQLAPFFGGVIPLRGVLFFGVITVLFLVLCRRQLDYFLSPKQLPFKIQTGLIVIVGFMLIWVGYQADSYHDMTQNQSQTLATEAQAIASQITEPISLQIFVNRDAQQRHRLERLVGRFKPYLSQLTVEWINPETDPDQARAAGVTQNGEIVINYADRQSHVTVPTDTNLTYAFYRLLVSSQVWTVFLEGLGGRQPFGAEAADFGYFSQQLEQLGTQLQRIDLPTERSIPDNTTSLIVSGYDHALALELDSLLRDFVADGGNVLLLVDPDQINDANPVLSNFGVSVEPGRLIDPRGMTKLNLPNPAFLAIEKNVSHTVTDPLTQPLLLPIACSLSFTDLLNSSLAPLLNAPQVERLLIGKHAKQPPPVPAASHKAVVAVASPQDQAQGRVAVVCDSDFLSNAYVGNGSNLDFGLNLIRWLNGEKQSIALPQPTKTDLKLTLSPLVAASFELVFKLLIPALLISIGGLLHWRRKRKQE